MNQTVPAPFVILAASGALLVYHFDRAFLYSPEDALNAPQRLEWLNEHRWWVYSSTAVAALLGIVSAFYLGWMWFIAAFVLGGIGILYSIRFLPKRRRPKDIGQFKSVLIIACWVGGGALVPLLVDLPEGVRWTTIALFASYRISYILPNILAADLLDRAGDRTEGIAGLGSAMSESALRTSSLLILALALTLVWLLAGRGVNLILLSIDAMGVVGLVLTILLTKKARPGHMAILDLWAGFPIATWAVSHFIV